MQAFKSILIFLIIIALIGGSGFFVTKLYQEKNEKRLIDQTRNKLLSVSPLPNNAIKLKKISYFPSENNLILERKVFLNNPSSIHVDPKNIYICDSGLNKILIFTKDGSYFSSIGSTGQGPTEFMSPLRIKSLGDTLLVHDVGNMRIQILNKDGKYIKSFKIFSAYYDVAAYENKIYATLSVSLSGNLIDVIDMNGRKLFSFGDLIYNIPKANILNWTKMDVSPDGSIFVAFESLPIIRKYSHSGKLLWEKKIKNKAMTFKEEKNLENVFSRKRSGPMTTALVISSLKVKDDRFFILHQFPLIEIDEYDMDGNIKNVYWDYDINGIIKDFEIERKDNTFIFYILDDSGCAIYTHE